MGDAIQQIIGSFGLYQLIIFFVVSLSRIFIGYHMLIFIFLAPETTYFCDGDPNKNNTCPCENPVYDRSVFTNTILMKWNLICEKGLLDNLAYTLYHLGSLFGSLLFGAFSDAYGRKYALWASGVLQFVTSISSAGVDNFILFTTLRFFLGVAVGGSMIISFVYIMETVGSKHRERLSGFHKAPFALGHCLLPVFAYFIRDFQEMLFWTSIGQFFMLTYIFLPESPRWLIATNKLDEAVAILTKIAQINGRSTANMKTHVIRYHESLQKYEDLKRKHAHELLSTKQMRKHTIVMAYLWFSCSFCFYGVAIYIGHLPGNIFLNVGCSGVFGVIGNVVFISMMQRYGRKQLISIMNFVAFTCFVMVSFMQDYGEMLFSTLGFCATTIVFVLLYMFTLELFPTVVRNTALGVTNMCGRVGAMLAAFVVEANRFNKCVPPIIFCLPPLIAGFVAFLLPETKGVILSTTIKESEAVVARSPTDKYVLEDLSDYDTLF